MFCGHPFVSHTISSPDTWPIPVDDPLRRWVRFGIEGTDCGGFAPVRELFIFASHTSNKIRRKQVGHSPLEHSVFVARHGECIRLLNLHLLLLYTQVPLFHPHPSQLRHPHIRLSNNCSQRFRPLSRRVTPPGFLRLRLHTPVL